MEMTTSVYLKQLLTPEIVLAICNNKPTKVKNEIPLLAVLTRKLVKEKNLKKDIENFCAVVGYVAYVEFMFVEEDDYFDVDMLDNAFYLLVGKIEKAGIAKGFIKQFIIDCFKSYFGISDKTIDTLIWKYQDKKEKLPQQIGGANVRA